MLIPKEIVVVKKKRNIKNTNIQWYGFPKQFNEKNEYTLKNIPVYYSQFNWIDKNLLNKGLADVIKVENKPRKFKIIPSNTTQRFGESTLELFKVIDLEYEYVFEVKPEAIAHLLNYSSIKQGGEIEKECVLSFYGQSYPDLIPINSSEFKYDEENEKTINPKHGEVYVLKARQKNKTNKYVYLDKGIIFKIYYGSIYKPHHRYASEERIKEFEEAIKESKDKKVAKMDESIYHYIRLEKEKIKPAFYLIDNVKYWKSNDYTSPDNFVVEKNKFLIKDDKFLKNTGIKRIIDKIKDIQLSNMINYLDENNNVHIFKKDKLKYPYVFIVQNDYKHDVIEIYHEDTLSGKTIKAKIKVNFKDESLEIEPKY